jgi:hypothetical protein
MKEDDEFLKKMENLNVPEVNPTGHPQMVKMAIMNADRSAALGVWLVAVPCYFLACVFMYYFFNRQVSWFGAMFKLAEGLDKTPGIDFMAPIVLVVLPIVCIIINALAITHVHYDNHASGKPGAKEFVISIKLKTWNIVLILISMAIVFTFIAFTMTENISIRN